MNNKHRSDSQECMDENLSKVEALLQVGMNSALDVHSGVVIHDYLWVIKDYITQVKQIKETISDDAVRTDQDAINRLLSRNQDK